MSLVRPAKEVLGRGWANFGELREGEVRRNTLLGSCRSATRPTATDTLGSRGLAVLPPGQQYAQTYRSRPFQAHQQRVFSLPACGLA